MLHSVIDGLSVGVFDEVSSMIVLSLSVLIHKIPVSCTLGMTFQNAGMQKSSCIAIAIFLAFILASPIGLFLGQLISQSELTLVLVIIQSLAAGTLVYLATCDLLFREFHKNQSESTAIKGQKFIATFLGCGFILALMVAFPE